MNENKGVKQKNNTQTIYFSDSFELSYVYGILYYPDAKNEVVVSYSSINIGSWSTRHWATKEQFSACVCVCQCILLSVSLLPVANTCNRCEARKDVHKIYDWFYSGSRNFCSNLEISEAF